MEQIHTRAIEALQPFVHLATSTASPSARFVANLITNATSAPNTYVFAELLETQAVQSLGSQDTPEEYRGYLSLLQIFAWGTWEEYHSTPNLPSLNEEQSQKLRFLSLLTLSTIHNPLTYPIVMKSLSLENHAALESLVTKAIYSSLITARLSPTSSPPIVRVTSVAPLRDVRPQTVDTVISALTEWQNRCKTVIDGIESEITNVRTNAQKKQTREKERAALLEKAVSGKDEDGLGDGGLGGMASGGKRSLRFLREGSGGGHRGPFAGAFSGGNKRDPYSDVDEGFGEGAGSRTRSSKRMLGMGSR